MFRKVVYTTMFGKQEPLKDPEFVSDCDYICFTDLDVKSDVWQIRQPKYSIPNGQLLARRYKTHPMEYLPNYDIWIWQDNLVIFKKDVQELVDQLDGGDLALYLHQDRKNVEEELEACIKWHKDIPQIMKGQITEYFQLGFPKDYPLYETTVIVYQKSSEQFLDFWFHEILKNSIRDQLSFGYSAWRKNPKITTLSPGGVFNNPYFVRQIRSV